MSVFAGCAQVGGGAVEFQRDDDTRTRHNVLQHCKILEPNFSELGIGRGRDFGSAGLDGGSWPDFDILRGGARVARFDVILDRLPDVLPVKIEFGLADIAIH